ncbi:MAG: hypothetical protein ABW321_16770 [Polyangiales bacterium]
MPTFDPASCQSRSVDPLPDHLQSLEAYNFEEQLPPDTRKKLKAVFAHWSESERAEALVRAIIAESPDTLGARIVAYRFYFFRRRSREAADWALSCLAWVAAELSLPVDWRLVAPEMLDFSQINHVFVRTWLQSLTAYSYNMARLGEREVALAALQKLLELDPDGRCGASRLRNVLEHPHEDAGLVFAKEPENRRYPNFQFRRTQDL